MGGGASIMAMGITTIGVKRKSSDQLRLPTYQWAKSSKAHWGIEAARWTKVDQMRVGAYLKTRQWERYQARSGAVREWPNVRFGLKATAKPRVLGTTRKN
jgi:hypothetical protein